MGHHFSPFNRLPICPNWALKALFFQLTSRTLTHRNPFAPPFSRKSHNWSWKEAKQGLPSPHISLLTLPGKGGSGDEKLVG